MRECIKLQKIVVKIQHSKWLIIYGINKKLHWKTGSRVKIPKGYTQTQDIFSAKNFFFTPLEGSSTNKVFCLSNQNQPTGCIGSTKMYGNGIMHANPFDRFYMVVFEKGLAVWSSDFRLLQMLIAGWMWCGMWSHFEHDLQSNPGYSSWHL